MAGLKIANFNKIKDKGERFMKKSKVLAIMLSVFGAAAVASLCVACNDGETKYVELDSTVL